MPSQLKCDTLGSNASVEQKLNGARKGLVYLPASQSPAAAPVPRGDILSGAVRVGMLAAPRPSLTKDVADLRG